MNFHKLGTYLMIFGVAVIAVNFFYVTSKLPEFPDLENVSKYNRYYRLSIDQAQELHSQEVSWAYKCLYGRIGVRDCVGDGTLPYFNFFAIFVFFIGLIVKKSSTKQPENEPPDE